MLVQRNMAHIVLVDLESFADHLDELTAKIQSETDDKKRNEMIREAFKIHQDDVGHIPLHQQALAWAYSNKVSLTQLPNNFMNFKWITLKTK